MYILKRKIQPKHAQKHQRDKPKVPKQTLLISTKRTDTTTVTMYNTKVVMDTVQCTAAVHEHSRGWGTEHVIQPRLPREIPSTANLVSGLAGTIPPWPPDPAIC